MYVNALILLRIWECTVRDWLGDACTIRCIKGFQMNRFTTVAETALRGYRVNALKRGIGLITLDVHTENSQGTTVGPGTVNVTLPRSSRRAGSNGCATPRTLGGQ
jgi:hypothetical protein